LGDVASSVAVIRHPKNPRGYVKPPARRMPTQSRDDTAGRCRATRRRDRGHQKLCAYPTCATARLPAGSGFRIVFAESTDRAKQPNHGLEPWRCLEEQLHPRQSKNPVDPGENFNCISAFKGILSGLAVVRWLALYLGFTEALTVGSSLVGLLRPRKQGPAAPEFHRGARASNTSGSMTSLMG
jgi:hypothetical protein